MEMLSECLFNFGISRKILYILPYNDEVCWDNLRDCCRYVRVKKGEKVADLDLVKLSTDVRQERDHFTSQNTILLESHSLSQQLYVDFVLQHKQYVAIGLAHIVNDGQSHFASTLQTQPNKFTIASVT